MKSESFDERFSCFDERFSCFADIHFTTGFDTIIEVASEGEYIFVKKFISIWKQSGSFDHEIGFYKPNLRPEQIALLEKMHRFSR